MATFQKEQPGWDFVLKAPNGVVGKDLKHRADLLVLFAKAQVGKKTGALAKSISASITNDAQGLIATVIANDKKALMHHNGTKPHIILPVHAKTLRFYSHGRIVYAKIVRHPGTKPNRFLTDNLPKVVN